MYSIDNKWYLFGISSIGSTDTNRICLNNQSSYFTRVPKYTKWINQILELSDDSASTYTSVVTTDKETSSWSHSYSTKNMSAKSHFDSTIFLFFILISLISKFLV